MYLKVNFFGIFLMFFQLPRPSILGNIVVTHNPVEGPLYQPHLTKLPSSRDINIISVKPVSKCAKIFLAKDKSYPIGKDVHIFICGEDESVKGVGFRFGTSQVKNNRGMQLPQDGSLQAFSVILNDNANSISVENQYDIIFNYTFSSNNFVRNYIYFALSGEAEWETLTDYV